MSSPWIDAFDVMRDQLPASGSWLRVVNWLCLIGMVAAVIGGVLHFRQQRRADRGEAPGPNPASPLALFVLFAACVAITISATYRWIEVNHFPSQTMSEVLVMFSLGLLYAMAVLHFALKLGRIGKGWAIVDDALLGLVMLGTYATNVYSTTLTTGQRDLPPALQSYWFPPHLVALIFSYATLGIAGLVCLVYFATRFWSRIFHGERMSASQWLILLGLTFVPFSHFVTLPVLAVVLLVFVALKATRRLPEPAAMAGLEKTLDQVSYRAFCVGMPFLTAGLFMGAFWAQEAWANYWGWDSKENTALITWLVYVIYIHLRMLGGYRGEKAMAVLMGGALSIFLTFQVFGYLPDSQKSLHRYTDDAVVPSEGRAAPPRSDESARADSPHDDEDH
jgi:cytochrome c-type biogenesis protein CcsB